MSNAMGDMSSLILENISPKEKVEDDVRMMDIKLSPEEPGSRDLLPEVEIHENWANENILDPFGFEPRLVHRGRHIPQKWLLIVAILAFALALSVVATN